MFASSRSELLALLVAIKAEPEENTPKLALADWLQEQPGEADQARGRFLSLLVSSNPEWPFDPRLTSLWNDHEADWTGTLRGAGFRFGAAHEFFRWGLLFPTIDGAVVAPDLAPVTGTEEFAWVAGATVRAADAPTGTLIADAPFLSAVAGLRVAPGDGGRAFLTRFADTPRAGALLELDLSNWGRQWHPLAALARSPHLTKLRRLILRDGHLDVHDPFRRLWNSTGLPALRALDLSGCGLDTGAGSVIASATGFPALTELNLAQNRLYASGAAALVAGPSTGRLRRLSLAANSIGEAGAVALSTAKHLRNLTHLDLSGNFIPSRAAVELITADHLRTIEELNLSRNDIGDAAAQALAQCPGLPNLRKLDLTGNRIGSRTAKALRNRFGAALLLN